MFLIRAVARLLGYVRDGEADLRGTYGDDPNGVRAANPGNVAGAAAVGIIGGIQ